MPARLAVSLAAALLAASWLVACGDGAQGPAPAPDAPAAADTQTVPPAASTEPAAPAPAAAPMRVGLWVPCEGSVRVLESPDRIARLVDEARRLGVTDLFVQVYRGGRAWYDASLADATPYREILTATGEDPLALLLERAHAAGMRVHAWGNVLSLSTRRDAALLTELGPAVVQVDRRGRSVLDYPDLELPDPDRGWYRMGTRQVWLDPAAPGLAERLAAIFGELVARYPGLDGVHLDYIRHPDVLPFTPGARFGVGMDFGYGEASRARFRRETGLEPPFGDSLANANAWDEWRRARVTEVVARIRTAVRGVRPDVALSAAVWAYADRAYLSIFQDWRGWLDAGLLEFAVPMAYTLDDALLRQMAPALVRGLGGERVWVGLGAWLFARDPERLAVQLGTVRALSPPGVVLFSYDALVDAPGLLDVAVRELAP